MSGTEEVHTIDQSQPHPPHETKPVPEELSAEHAQFQHAQANYTSAYAANDAAQAEQHATELKALDAALGAQAQQLGHPAAAAAANGDYYTMWIEIHNTSGSATLRNRGGWDVPHGWFESDAVGDIAPGGVAYIKMGGGYFNGISVDAYFGYDGQSAYTIHWNWNPNTNEPYGWVGGGVKGQSVSWSGRIIYFYIDK